MHKRANTQEVNLDNTSVEIVVVELSNPLVYHFHT